MAPSSNRRGRYTEREMIAYLQQRAKDLGMVPTMRSLELMDGPGPLTYFYYFGSWRKALLAAGLIEPGLVSEDQADDSIARMRYTDEELLGFVQQFVNEHEGRAPTVAEFREWGLGDPNVPTPTTLSVRFGGWNRALQRAGYIASDSRIGRLSDRDLALDFLREAARDFGHEPTVAEYNDWVKDRREESLAAFEAEYGPKPEPSDSSPAAKEWRLAWREHMRYTVPVGARTLYRHFGSWTAAVMEALRPAPPKSRATDALDVSEHRAFLLQSLYQLARKLNRVPTSADVREYTAAHPKFPPLAAYRVAFGAWVDVKRHYQEWLDRGLTPDEPAPAPAVTPDAVQRERIVAGIHRLYLHLGRVPQAKDFDEAQRNPVAPQVPSYEDILRAFGAWPKARRVWSDTYHITKSPRGKGGES